MIYTALDHIRDELNQSFRYQQDTGEDRVVVSNIVEQDGSVPPHVDNKVLMFLVNIEKETAGSQRAAPAPTGEGPAAVYGPPLCLNLHVMFAAHFSGDNYDESLKAISHTVSFFQRRRELHPDVVEGAAGRIDRIVMDIENLDIRDLGSLWGVLSGKYLPSVLYKVRMVVFASPDVSDVESTITSVETRIGG